MNLSQLDEAMRASVCEIEGECLRRGIPASSFSFMLTDDGTWAVEYFTPVRGNCICHCSNLSGIYDALQSHIELLIELYGDAREPRSPAPHRCHKPSSPVGFSGKVRERDGACVKCGSTEYLHAHHVKPKSLFPELAKDPNNGITLCAKHHREAHWSVS